MGAGNDVEDEAKDTKEFRRMDPKIQRNSEVWEVEEEIYRLERAALGGRGLNSGVNKE